MPKAPKRAGTRDKMLAVAERLFAERGYDGTHLEHIAREVGVRKTALYYYFDSKEALYVAVLEGPLEALADAVTGILSSAELPIRARAERLIEVTHDLLAERPSYAQIVLRVFVDPVPFEASRIAAITQRMVAAVVAFFEQGVREGVFRKLSALHTFQSALGMAIFHYASGAAVVALLEGSDLHVPENGVWRREQFRDLIFRGILAEGER